MKLVLKCIAIIFLLLSPVLGDEVENLENELNRLQVQLEGSKIIVEAMQKNYDKALSSNDKSAINDAKISLDQAKLNANSLSIEAYRIRKIIDSIRNNTSDNGTRNGSLDIPASLSTEVILLPGWNSFSIPINISIKSSSDDLGSYSTIWTYDGNAKSWIKNPPVLYPGRGYFLHIVSGGYRMKFKGLSFSTDLSSITKKSRTWYFAGASSEIKDIDYGKYEVLKYIPYSYIKNPSKIDSGDAFWIFKK